VWNLVRTRPGRIGAGSPLAIWGSVGAYTAVLFGEKVLRTSGGGVFRCGSGSPLAGHRIAVLAGLSRASVSSAVNTLERDGHVARSREHDDRRMVTVSLTSSGEAAVRDSYREQHEVERALYAGLEEGERAELAHLLEALIDAPLD